MAFGILCKTGTALHDAVEVGVKVLELASGSFDVHCLFPPSIVHCTVLGGRSLKACDDVVTIIQPVIQI